METLPQNVLSPHLWLRGETLTLHHCRLQLCLGGLNHNSNWHSLYM